MTEILPRNWTLRKLGAVQQSGLLQKLILSAVVVLVAVAAFGLGRLTALQEQRGGLKIYAPSPNQPLATPTPLSDNNTPGGKVESSAVHNFVASKNGSKYYPAGCKSASRIKAANEVWFETASAAAAAGYSVASGCAAN